MGATFTGLSGKCKEDFGHGKASFVTYMNVFSNPIATSSMVESVEIDEKQNEIQYGDVFFTTSSETPEEVGMSSVWLQNCRNVYLNSFCFGYRPTEIIDPYYLAYMLRSDSVRNRIILLAQGISRYNISKNGVMEISVPLPSEKEQKLVGQYFQNLDNLITLHQRLAFSCSYNHQSFVNTSYVILHRGLKGEDKMDNSQLFRDYYETWIKVYKEGAVRKVTLKKYEMALNWVNKLVPDLRIHDLTRIEYQQLINEYALHHEKQTVMDFHHHLKGAILDALDEGLIEKDPTRKTIIKGKEPSKKKTKYLNQFELQTLIKNLELSTEITWDWFILLVAKTGMRYSEALALTPADFDFNHQTLSVSKTWDYKGKGGFLPTKNKSSVRKIPLDWHTSIQFAGLLKGLNPDIPIFTRSTTYNATVNSILAKRCRIAAIPVISVHGLRHTHASLLLFAGVSIASVARRLGHASMNTTQKTYLHIIQELENKDIDIIMRSLANLD